MIKIRNGTFETNSSSTHSIAIPKKKMGNYPCSVYFGYGEFGWEFAEESPADYLYTAILCYYDEGERKERLDRLKSILENHNIKYHFADPFTDRDYYIDHTEDLGEFLDKVFKDDDTLLTFIFSGMVFTGNDNCESDQSGYIYRFEKTYEDWSSNGVNERENPYYKEEYENYDWVVKGN